MKYLFALFFVYSFIKVYVLKKVENKKVYLFLTLISVILGLISIMLEPTLADVAKRWA